MQADLADRDTWRQIAWQRQHPHQAGTQVKAPATTPTLLDRWQYDPVAALLPRGQSPAQAHLSAACPRDVLARQCLHVEACEFRLFDGDMVGGMQHRQFHTDLERLPLPHLLRHRQPTRGAIDTIAHRRDDVDTQWTRHCAAQRDSLQNLVADIAWVEPHMLRGANLAADQALAGRIAPVDEEIVGPLAQIGAAGGGLTVIDDPHIEVLAHLDLQVIDDNRQHSGLSRHRYQQQPQQRQHTTHHGRLPSIR